ncbi:MAG: pullulanase-associated domain-containing protein, partial [Succinivibrionaceae bacterium]|nr:pullulanase-associated domain-containing protein [Succinivibrionaceae bacterium]
MNFNYKKLSLFVIGCMSSCLIACGGGGGSSSDPAPEVDLNTYEPSVQMPAEVQSPATPMASVTQKEGVVTLAWLNFDADNKTKLAELNLHIWDGAGCQTIASSFTKNADWDDTSVTPTRIDEYGAYWDIDVDSITGDPLCVIIRDKTKAKLTGSDEKFEIRHFAAATTAADDTNSGYILLSNFYSSDKYQVPADKTIKDVFTQKYKGPKSPLSIDGASAWWVDKDTFVVFPEKSEFAKLRLYLPKKDADLVEPEKDGKILGTFINLEESTLTPEIEQKLPIVTVKDDKDEAKYKAKVFKVPAEADFDAETEGKQEFSSANLKKEAALLGLAKDGKVTYQSRIKNALLLDNMYAEKASQLEYGAIVDKSGITFRVWAPTAQDVSVVLFEKDKTQKQVLPMTQDPETGAWSVSSSDAKHGTIYKYRIKMYHP